MKVISLNVNGIRASARKGLFAWLAQQDADIVCLQEVRAQAEQRQPEFYPENYHCYYVDAERKGYSGVAVFSKEKPLNVVERLGWPLADEEGRYLQVDFADLSVVSLYMPSGSSGDERQALKFDFLDRFAHHLRDIRGSGREWIICGDWNIAHKQIDIKNWRSNQKNSGFLPEERAWMDELVGPMGFVDAFRVLNQDADEYTWWSNRGRAWDNNVGWRIDYQIITPGLRDTVKAVSVYKDERFSDHAPLIIDYALS